MTGAELPTLILGAGPAGLTAGLELMRQGIPALLLEQDAVVGGLSRTVEQAGYRYDLGGHRFYTKSREVQEIWRDLLGADLLERPRLSRIFYRGRFFSYPLRPLDALAGLGPVEACRVVASWVRAQIFPPLDQRSFEDWVVARFGRRLFQIFFETYTEKVWGMPCRAIDADWAAQRIRNLDLGAAIRDALMRRSRRGDDAIVSLIDRFHYPRLGPGMMWERCRDRLAAAGIATWTGAPVVAVHHAAGRVAAVTVRTAEGVHRLDAAACISTLPLRRLVELLDPPPPRAVLDAAGRLRYRDFLIVALVLDRAEVFPDNWIYVHAPEVRVGRIQNFKNWSPEMVADPAATSLGLEYFVQEGDELWRAPDAQLVELASHELEILGLGDHRDVRQAAVLRVPKAYPIYDHGYREAIALVRGWLAGLSNFESAGRGGQHRYNNQDHSMLTGLCTARNVAARRAGREPEWDAWAVNADREHLESPPAAAPSELQPAERDSPRPLAAAGGGNELDDIVTRAFARYDPIALGAAVGIVGAVLLGLATTVGILRGGEDQGPTLSLLANYLPRYGPSWRGALIGCAEAAGLGFGLGFVIARAINALLLGAESALRRELQLAAALYPQEPPSP